MINVGELKPGDSLPPIRALAQQLDVAVNTVARAYQELEGLGLAEGNRRKGSYVKARPATSSPELTRTFKTQILGLIQQGLGKEEIADIFRDNLNQIFD